MKKILLICFSIWSCMLSAALDQTQEIAAATKEAVVPVASNRADLLLPFASMTSIANIPAEQFFSFIDLAANQQLLQQVKDARMKGLSDEAIITLLTSDFDTLILLENELLKLSIELAALQKEASWKKKKKVLKYLFGVLCVGGVAFAVYKYWDNDGGHNNNRHNNGLNVGARGGNLRPNPHQVGGRGNQGLRPVQPAPVVRPVQPAPVVRPVQPAPVVRPVQPAPVVRPVQPAPRPRPAAPVVLPDCAACLMPMVDAENPQPAIELDKCRHVGCHNACMITGIEKGLEEKDLKMLRCPVPGCHEQLTPQDLQKMQVAPKKIDELNQLLFDEYVINGGEVKHCPTPNCEVAFAPREGEKYSYFCISCQKEYCVQCLKPHDQAAPCALNAVDGDAKTEEALGETITQKRCNNCKKIVELNGGCKYVKCDCSPSYQNEICVACGFHTQRSHEDHPCCVRGVFIDDDEIEDDRKFKAAWDKDEWHAGHPHKIAWDRKKAAARARRGAGY